MALRVWLPLTGTLENKGISNITVTNNGATIETNGKIGSCYSFNGTNGYFQFSNFNPSGWSEMSIAFWCYPTASFNGFFLIRGSGAHRMGISSDGFKFRDTNNSTQRYLAFSTPPQMNVWTHVVCIYKHGEMFIYKNGILDAHSTTYYNANSTLLTDLNEIRIARSESSSGNVYYTGKLNDVRIYDHCLSAAEVKEISYGLVLHYKLDDITNGIVDSSGYEHNGTIIGTATLTSSPRYSNGISMNNTSTANRIDATSLPTEVSTVSLWVKGAKATNQVYFADKNSGLEFGTYSSLGATNLSSKALYNLTDFVNNEWNHIVVIKDSTNNKLYINGKLATTSSSNNYYTHNGGLYLFNRNANNNYACNGSISDFRAYCTILSEEDILSLYHTAAKVDNLGGLHTFEF